MLSDEGLGPQAVERLVQSGLPENVKAYDAGVSLSTMLSLCEGFDKMVIVDAVRGGGRPGDIYRFTLEELEQDKNLDLSFKLSLHEIDVPKAIALERLVARLPEEIVVVGMEPESMTPGMELSATVAGRMESLLAKIREELDK